MSLFLKCTIQKITCDTQNTKVPMLETIWHNYLHLSFSCIVERDKVLHSFNQDWEWLVLYWGNRKGIPRLTAPDLRWTQKIATWWYQRLRFVIDGDGIKSTKTVRWNKPTLGYCIDLPVMLYTCMCVPTTYLCVYISTNIPYYKSICFTIKHFSSLTTFFHKLTAI